LPCEKAAKLGNVLTSLQALLRLATLRWLGVFICALAVLLATTSSASALEPAQTKTRVWGFDFAEHNSYGLFLAASSGKHRGNQLARAEEASGSLLAARGATTLESSAIRFSQSSVNGAEEIAASMAKNGWVGAPVDVVSVGGRLVTVDNTRVLAAHMTGTPVQALVHGAGEALPASMAGRFGAATTWGEAVTARIAGQNAAYRAANPMGSWFIGVTP
jgi:hypothetical protein